MISYSIGNTPQMYGQSFGGQPGQCCFVYTSQIVFSNLNPLTTCAANRLLAAQCFFLRVRYNFSVAWINLEGPGPLSPWISFTTPKKRQSARAELPD